MLYDSQCCYKPRTPSPRILATIDVNTGVATAIGNAQETFASIAFNSKGTLYGVTGDGGATSETLFTIDINTGNPTQLFPLGNGNDGEAITFSPLDGLIYHASGFAGTINVNRIFETVNPNNSTTNQIILTGDTDSYDEMTTLVYTTGVSFLITDIDSNFNSLTTSGVITSIGTLDHVSKGFAFDCGVPSVNVPTLSEWGLVTTVIVLGLISFFVLRRRAVLQK